MGEDKYKTQTSVDFYYNLLNRMSLKLYKMDACAPACAAMMICGYLDAPVEMIDVDFMGHENLTPEYMKKNPMHTIPILEDGDLIIHDSHVILTYLTEKYGKDDSLYPKDLKKRARVDQKLCFDALVFYRTRSITFPAVFEGVRKPADNLIKALAKTYDFLEAFLNTTKFVADDVMTIADISLVASIAGARYVIPIDEKKYPKIQAWFSYMEKQPFYQKYTASGTAQFKKLLEQYLRV